MLAQEFFSNDITKLEKYIGYNVLCHNKNNGLYCYAFLNKKTGQLSTGYKSPESVDLDYCLDQDEWTPILEVDFSQNHGILNRNQETQNNSKEKNISKIIKTITVLVMNNYDLIEIFNFHKNDLEYARDFFLLKIKEKVNSEQDIQSSFKIGCCFIDSNGDICIDSDDSVDQIYLVHSS